VQCRRTGGSPALVKRCAFLVVVCTLADRPVKKCCRSAGAIFAKQKPTEVERLATAISKFFCERNVMNSILATVAKAVNISTFYFCKLFKRTTGLTFTDYLARVRIEKAKRLLLDQNRRTSEVAYEVGFQSLTHFNRVFKKLAGRSLTSYRQSVCKLA
jgi:AraC-like DNA-binding protein